MVRAIAFDHRIILEQSYTLRQQAREIRALARMAIERARRVGLGVREDREGRFPATVVPRSALPLPVYSCRTTQ
jgi:hypothetical protein